MDVNSSEIKAYVNLDEGMGRVRGNKKLYKRMLGMYLAGKEFEMLETALAEGNLTAAADVAHAIKGMTGNLSLTAVFNLSTQMMMELRTGAYNKELHDSFKDACEKTTTILDYVINEHLKD